MRRRCWHFWRWIHAHDYKQHAYWLEAKCFYKPCRRCQP